MKRRTTKREPGNDPRDDPAAAERPVHDAGYVSASTAIAAFMGAPPVDPALYGAEAADPPPPADRA